jgi:hypothetical protein
VKLLWLLLLASSAFAGVGNLPAQHGAQDICTAKAYNPMQIDSCRFVYSIVNKDVPYVYHWNIFSVLDSYADDGEPVGIYTNVNQRGQGAVFGLVTEVQCNSPHAGNCWGQETDIAAPVSGEPRGYGNVVVIARSIFGPRRDPNDNRVGHVLTGFGVIPFYPDAGKVDVGVAFDAQVHCTVACVRIPDGEAMAYSSNGLIVQKFDPQTGYAGWWRADLGLCVWCVNMSNGDIKMMWKP